MKLTDDHAVLLALFVSAAAIVSTAVVFVLLMSADAGRTLTPADGVEFCVHVLDEPRDWCEGKG